MDLSDTRALRLQIALLRRRMTQQDLAKALEADPGAVSKLVKHGLEFAGGKVTWARAAEALGLTVADLEPGSPWDAIVAPKAS